MNKSSSCQYFVSFHHNLYWFLMLQRSIFALTSDPLVKIPFACVLKLLTNRITIQIFVESI